MLRALRLLAAAAALALALATTAVAADDFEPNDTAATAYGPLNAEESFQGETTTAEDQDWFWFDTAGPGTLTVQLYGGEACAYASLRIGDASGKMLAHASTFSLEAAPLSLTYTAAARGQHTVEVMSSAGCAYSLTADPADVVVVRPPGVTAHLGHTGDLDGVQRVLVDGKVIGEAAADQEAWVDLGVLAPAAHIAFEAQNASGTFGWDVRLTATAGDRRTTIFEERSTGGGTVVNGVRQRTGPRIGIVRRVVLDPAGTVLESCGDRNATVLCFPLDRDLDGVPDSIDQCDGEAAPGSPTGCPDRDGDGERDLTDRCPDTAGPVGGCPDADGDLVPDRTDACPTFAGRAPTGCPVLQRFASTLSLRHRGRRFTGKLVNLGPGCVAGREVTLAKVLGAKKTLGRATTTRTGTFTIVLRKRPRRGPFKVSVAEVKLTPATLCRAGSSRVVH